MNILQVSMSDSGGGAEKIAYDLFSSYHTLGHQSWLAVGTKMSRNTNILRIPNRNKVISQFIRTSTRKLPYTGYLNEKIEVLINPTQTFANTIGHEFFGYPGTWDLLSLSPEPPDVLQCHNLHKDYFDLRVLPELSHQVPTVLTLHDAWLLSGHCAHSFDCERWKRGCGNCPDLSIYPAIRRDATAYNWQRKAEIYKKSRLCVVTPCQWLMDKVERSMLKQGVVSSRVIPNGVDLKVFHPANQPEAREELMLPVDAKILLFAAHGIRNNIWKDYRTLRSALEEVATSGTKMLCIALGEKGTPERIGNVEIRFIPYQKNIEKVARYYQAADLYVHPARAETFPSTVLEALACGIPVVASEVGGIPEQVEEGRTGHLVPVGDAHAMAEGVIYLLENEEFRQTMGSQAADHAARQFGVARMVRDYLTFYEEILE